MRIFEQKKISKFLKHYFGGYFNKVLVQDNCFFCFVYLINMTNSEINQLRFLLAKQNCFLSSCKKTILEKKLNIEHTDNVVIPFHFFGSIFVIKGHVNDLLPFIGWLDEQKKDKLLFLMLYVHPYIFQKDNLRFLFKTFIQNKNLVTMKTRHVFLLNIIRNLSEGNLIKFIQNIKKPLYLLTINLRFLGQKKSYNKLNS